MALLNCSSELDFHLVCVSVLHVYAMIKSHTGSIYIQICSQAVCHHESVFNLILSFKKELSR